MRQQLGDMTETLLKSPQLSPKATAHRPSSPRQFFARLYGHLETNEDTLPSEQDELPAKNTPEDICRSQATVLPFGVFNASFGGSLPFVLPRDDGLRLGLNTTEAHLAGFSAFCKYSLFMPLPPFLFSPTIYWKYGSNIVKMDSFKLLNYFCPSYY